MPIIKSAKKRVRVTRKASVANAKTKRTMRESIKAFQNKLSSKKDTTKEQAEAYSAIDTAYKKGVISKNKAARKKSQLNAASKAAGTTKPGAKKATAKKSAPAKRSPVVTSKKSTTGKPAATKKPAAKKAPAKKTAK